MGQSRRRSDIDYHASFQPYGCSSGVIYVAHLHSDGPRTTAGQPQPQPQPSGMGPRITSWKTFAQKLVAHFHLTSCSAYRTWRTLRTRLVSGLTHAHWGGGVYRTVCLVCAFVAVTRSLGNLGLAFGTRAVWHVNALIRKQRRSTWVTYLENWAYGFLALLDNNLLYISLISILHLEDSQQPRVPICWEN